MLEQPRKRYLLLGCELEFDSANPPQAIKALAQASGVVSLSAFLNDSLREHADVVLPIATFAETYGTWVNATGNWQSVRGACSPPAEARPGWKVLRVLADTLELDGFGYDSPESVTRELQQRCANIELNNLVTLATTGDWQELHSGGLLRAGETPIYATDPLVRRSQPLQKTRDGKQAWVSMASSELERLQLSDGDAVALQQNGATITLPVRSDDGVPTGCVWLPAGLPETQALGDLFGPIEVKKA
jgi:NADH-quinone oxidoreductase subunit G